MSSELVTIEATVREKTGKGYNRKIRVEGRIPGVILDKGKATSIELNAKWLHKAYQAEGRRFNLSLNGESKVVFIKDLQINAVKRMPLHVDLMYA